MLLFCKSLVDKICKFDHLSVCFKISTFLWSLSSINFLAKSLLFSGVFCIQEWAPWSQNYLRVYRSHMTDRSGWNLKCCLRQLSYFKEIYLLNVPCVLKV